MRAVKVVVIPSHKVAVSHCPKRLPQACHVIGAIDQLSDHVLVVDRVFASWRTPAGVSWTSEIDWFSGWWMPHALDEGIN